MLKFKKGDFIFSDKTHNIWEVTSDTDYSMKLYKRGDLDNGTYRIGSIGNYKNSQDCMHLIERLTNLAKIMENTSIISRFINRKLKEPEKTYHKLKIMDDKDMLTSDGKELYLNYLLRKDTTFFAEVAQPMLVEIDAESKK